MGRKGSGRLFLLLASPPPADGTICWTELGFCLDHPPSPGPPSQSWGPPSPSCPSGRAGPGGTSAITSLSYPLARPAGCTPLWVGGRSQASPLCSPWPAMPASQESRHRPVTRPLSPHTCCPRGLRGTVMVAWCWWALQGGQRHPPPGSCSDRKDEAVLSRASSGL